MKKWFPAVLLLAAMSAACAPKTAVPVQEGAPGQPAGQQMSQPAGQPAQAGQPAGQPGQAGQPAGQMPLPAAEQLKQTGLDPNTPNDQTAQMISICMQRIDAAIGENQIPPDSKIKELMNTAVMTTTQPGNSKADKIEALEAVLKASENIGNESTILSTLHDDLAEILELVKKSEDKPIAPQAGAPGNAPQAGEPNQNNAPQAAPPQAKAPEAKAPEAKDKK